VFDPRIVKVWVVPLGSPAMKAPPLPTVRLRLTASPEVLAKVSVVAGSATPAAGFSSTHEAMTEPISGTAPMATGAGAWLSTTANERPKVLDVPRTTRRRSRSSRPRVTSASWGTSSRRVSVVDNSEVVIKVRDNGPYKVTGPVTVVDAVGNRFELGDEPIALCRCGHSERKPFCDASHRTTGFAACDRA
jgi:CDGSH iron-sulfur domain-containing protein 3